MSSIESIYRYLPPRIRDEVDRSLPRLLGEVSELHIRLGSGSGLRSLSSRVYLGITVSEDDVEYILNAFTGGALYAYRESIREGYLSLGAGIRVGVCGQARYEGERLIGVSRVSSLLIRFPCFECAFTDRLCEAFLSAERGLMIFAPPCSAKTTALRSLLLRLSGMGVGRISLIDERCEVVTDDFKFSDIDVFCGYRRADGIRTALRVMSPDIIAVDELCVARESFEIIESLLSGVKFIATAHARDFRELSKRPAVAPFLELGIFDVFCKIFHTDTGLECDIFGL